MLVASNSAKTFAYNRTTIVTESCAVFLAILQTKFTNNYMTMSFYVECSTLPNTEPNANPTT